MAKQPARAAQPRVVDFGKGPQIFATKLIGSRVDAGALTITFGVEEFRGERAGDPVDAAHIVYSVVGYLVLTKPAAAELASTLNNIFATVATAEAQEGSDGPN